MRVCQFRHIRTDVMSLYLFSPSRSAESNIVAR